METLRLNNIKTPQNSANL